MRAPSPQAITQLLLAWQAGDRQALDLLVPVVHEELRRLAHRSMKRERAGHLLQTTALVNEAYLNLVDARKVMWRDRVHFFAICARLMREILVHYARGRDALKRGGGFRQVTLDESALYAPAPDAELLDLDDALTALELVRRAKGEGRGTALLRRADARGDRGSAEACRPTRWRETGTSPRPGSIAR